MIKENAIERIVRILDLIPVLHGGRYAINDIADRYQISPLQIQRDLELAFMCGLPGYTPDILIDLSLEDGFIEIYDPLVLQTPRAISFEDLVSISLGLEILKSATDQFELDTSLINSLHKKLQNSITPLAIPIIVSDEIKANINLIDISIGKKFSFVFDYIDGSGIITKNRQVMCLKIASRGKVLILESFDIEKNQFRFFRVDRISTAQLGPIVDINIIHEPDLSFKIIKFQIPLEEKWWILRFSEFVEEEHSSLSSEIISVTMKYWDRDWLIRTIAPISRDLVFPYHSQKDEDQLRFELKLYLHGIKV